VAKKKLPTGPGISGAPKPNELVVPQAREQLKGLLLRLAIPVLGSWVLCGLLAGFVNMVVGFVPCIGWIIGLVLSLGSGVYITAVHAHLFGQFGRAAFTMNQSAPTTPPTTLR